MKQPFDLLESNLLDLLYELREAEEAHLLPLIPEVRSTNDLDMFLTTDVIVDLPKAKAVLEAVQRLEFAAVEKKENFQFIKTFQRDRQSLEVKIDFLTPMPDNPAALRILDIQDRRVRNKRSGGIHAFKTEEAIAVEDNPIPIVLAGVRTTGEEFSGQVYLPQAYAYLLMKLFAFHDWEIKKQNPGYSRKHALDLYNIAAMMTEEELAAAEQASSIYQHKPEAQEAASIVQGFFARTTDLGNLLCANIRIFLRTQTWLSSSRF